MRRFLGRGTGRGLRRNNAKKVCTCPKCGYTSDYTRGIPCTEKKCPKCGTTMKGEYCL